MATLLRLKAHAKINLTFDIISRRQDGYHDIRSVMQKLEVHDLVTLREAPQGIRLAECGQTPSGKGNLAYRAAELVMREYPLRKGVEISLHKEIPIAAGLAGGSADAAAVLAGLKELWGLEISEAQMLRMASEIGSDVPFCVDGPVALAMGKGDVLCPVKPMKPFWVLLACPRGEISASQAYHAWDASGSGGRPDTQKCLEAIALEDLEGLGKALGNVFEQTMAKAVPDILRLKHLMMGAGALGASMTGSGPTIFGVFASQAEAFDALDSLRKKERLRYLAVTRSLAR